MNFQDILDIFKVRQIKAENEQLKNLYDESQRNDLFNQVNTARSELEQLKMKNQKVKLAFDAMKKALKTNSDLDNLNLQTIQNAEDVFTSEIELPLNCMNVKQLRNLYNQNKKNIQDVLKKYEKRYTSKANKSIYQLMIIGLEAELQNILINYK